MDADLGGFEDVGSSEFDVGGINEGTEYDINEHIGEFDIIDWDGYPDGPKPTGPFRLLEGDDYDEARGDANQANHHMHEENLELDDLQIHEIQPVKFGGSPTDPDNKIALTPEEHAEYTTWWNNFQRTMEAGS